MRAPTPLEVPGVRNFESQKARGGTKTQKERRLRREHADEVVRETLVSTSLG